MPDTASPNIDAMWENGHPLSNVSPEDFPMHFIACAIMVAGQDVSAQLARIADRLDSWSDLRDPREQPPHHSIRINGVVR